MLELSSTERGNRPDSTAAELDLVLSQPVSEMDPIQASQQETPPNGQTTPASYLWHPAGRAVALEMDFDLIDRLSQEIMRSVGGNRIRGSEVGGILLGSVRAGEPSVVRVEEFLPIACEHTTGPSYVLCEAETQAFDEALAQWQPGPGRFIYAVGCYRACTRENFELSADDLALTDSRFTHPFSVCLLIRPYATKPCEAVFHSRESGRFDPESQPEPIQFRRRELGGGAPPKRNRENETNGVYEDAPQQQRGADAPQRASDPAPSQPAPNITAPTFGGLAPAPAIVVDPPLEQPAKQRSGWVWIPLSFIFLLLGVVLGSQITLSLVNKKAPDTTGDPYLLDLGVTQLGQSLHLKWNPDAPVVRRAQRGTLTIQDGDGKKSVDLSPDDLKRGGVVYRNATGNVQFRLEVFPRERNSVSESLELKLLDSNAPAAAGEPAAAKESAPPQTAADDAADQTKAAAPKERKRRK